ncbi:MAG TPA: (Na+)-NQR maturation NqrM [Pirellulaceae bacterium]|jgi:hypothetical protein|nr:(Na+)-NQR maturation NqrM [Pirellulaceae bacterium]
MIPTILIAFVVFALAALAMAVGVIVSGRTIKGSCGGLAAMKDENGESVCMSCSRRTEGCSERGDRVEEDAAV